MWACAFSTWLLPRQPQVLQGHTESVYCFLNLLDHERDGDDAGDVLCKTARQTRLVSGPQKTHVCPVHALAVLARSTPDTPPSAHPFSGPFRFPWWEPPVCLTTGHTCDEAFCKASHQSRRRGRVVPPPSLHRGWNPSTPRSPSREALSPAL